jgi:uncharacterized protein
VGGEAGEVAALLAGPLGSVPNPRARSAAWEGSLSEWFFTSDLHGHSGLYEQVVALVAAHRPRVVILGGDLAPHAAGVDGLRRQRVFFEGLFVEFGRRVRDGSPGTELLLLMGNDDWRDNLKCLERHDGSLWRLLHERVVDVDGTPVAGLSWVPITPFSIKDWERWDDGGDEAPVTLDGWVSHDGALVRHRFDPGARQPTIADALEGLATLAPPGRTLYVSHSPPHGTHCDLTHARTHVGSRALRAFIERHVPPLVLSGHIHESPRMSDAWCDRLGETVVVNPGQFGNARLAGVWFAPGRIGDTLRHTLHG